MMITLEREVVQLKERLERLEEKVELLAEDRPRRGPSTIPGQPLSEQQLLDWLKAKGLIREPTAEEYSLANEWNSLPEEKKKAYIEHMRNLVLDPPLSQIIMENRR